MVATVLTAATVNVKFYQLTKVGRCSPSFTAAVWLHVQVAYPALRPTTRLTEPAEIDCGYKTVYVTNVMLRQNETN